MTEEERADEAHALDQQVRTRVRAMRTAWIYLGRDLHEFTRLKGWKALGLGSQEEWLADPEIGLSRTQSFRLMQAYEQLVLERGVKIEALEGLDSSKIWEVLPAIRRGADAERAIADVKTLSQPDLREAYSKPPGVQPHSGTMGVDSFHYEKCPTCGQSMRVED